MYKVKLIFIGSFIAIWLIPIISQLILNILSTWIYVDLIFLIITGIFMYFVYKEVTH